MCNPVYLNPERWISTIRNVSRSSVVVNKAIRLQSILLIEMHSVYNVLNTLLSRYFQLLSHEIVRRPPEKTRSGSSLIAGIDKISIAI